VTHSTEQRLWKFEWTRKKCQMCVLAQLKSENIGKENSEWQGVNALSTCL